MITLNKIKETKQIIQCETMNEHEILREKLDAHSIPIWYLLETKYNLNDSSYAMDIEASKNAENVILFSNIDLTQPFSKEKE